MLARSDDASLSADELKQKTRRDHEGHPESEIQSEPDQYPSVAAENSIRRIALSPSAIQGYGRVVWTVARAVLGAIRALFRTQRELALENLALRQQVAVLLRTRGVRRVRLGVWDRLFWVMLSRTWNRWKHALAIVEPATVVRWHREYFRGFWRRRSQSRLGRPGLDQEVVKLIRRMARANVTWGAPRIRNELAMLGIEVAVSIVARYMPARRKPPSPTWRAFLDNVSRTSWRSTSSSSPRPPSASCSAS